MPKLPVVSGTKVIKLLGRLEYRVIRQKGSHVRLRKETEVGEHNITVPMHSEIARGTLNDILSQISIWNAIPKSRLLEILREL